MTAEEILKARKAQQRAAIVKALVAKGFSAESTSAGNLDITLPEGDYFSHAQSSLLRNAGCEHDDIGASIATLRMGWFDLACTRLGVYDAARAQRSEKGPGTTQGNPRSL